VAQLWSLGCAATPQFIMTPLEQLVNRANLALKDRAGFVSCHIHSETPPVIAYTFSSDAAANAYKLSVDMVDSSCKRVITNSEPSVIYEYR
jgi:hypothetical protein